MFFQVINTLGNYVTVAIEAIWAVVAIPGHAATKDSPALMSAGEILLVGAERSINISFEDAKTLQALLKPTVV